MLYELFNRNVDSHWPGPNTNSKIALVAFKSIFAQDTPLPDWNNMSIQRRMMESQCTILLVWHKEYKTFIIVHLLVPMLFPTRANLA